MVAEWKQSEREERGRGEGKAVKQSDKERKG